MPPATRCRSVDAGSAQSLDSGKLLSAQIDLRLVPEFDPTIVERVAQSDPCRLRRAVAELELLHDRRDRGRVERLLEHRQHLKSVLRADALDVLEHRRAAGAHELNESEVATLAECDDGFDRNGEIQADIEEDNVGRLPFDRLLETRAVGEFLGVDAGAVQDQRQEMADACLFVDDKAGRDGRRVHAGYIRPLAAARRLLSAVQAFGHAPRSRLRLRNVGKFLRWNG